MARILNGAEFKELVIDSGEKVLVDFFATWCGPCQMMAPVIDELAEEATDFKVYKVDVDVAEAVAEDYNIMSIPTLILFDKGAAVKKKVGALSKDAIIEFVNA